VAGSFSDPAQGTLVFNNGWNTTSYPLQGTSNKMCGVQFNVPTTTNKNILLVWEQRHSNTASKYTRLQYTTNGTDFIDRDVIVMGATNNSFVFYSVDLSGVPGVSSNDNFGFRFVTEFESTATNGTGTNYVGTATGLAGGYNAGPSGGTIRYDLVSVYGNPLSTVTPIPLVIRRDGSNVILSWSDPAFVLQSAPTINGTYNTIAPSSPVTNSIGGSEKYYRLKTP
jgi:uncharacterized protein